MFLESCPLRGERVGVPSNLTFNWSNLSPSTSIARAVIRQILDVGASLILKRLWQLVYVFKSVVFGSQIAGQTSAASLENTKGREILVRTQCNKGICAMTALERFRGKSGFWDFTYSADLIHIVNVSHSQVAQAFWPG